MEAEIEIEAGCVAVKSELGVHLHFLDSNVYEKLLYVHTCPLSSNAITTTAAPYI